MSRQIILLLVCVGWPSVSSGTVLNVPTPAYPTIQSAIQAAVAGDEVVVAPGVYNEAISFGATAITVRSSGGSAVTTIDVSGLDLRVVKFFPGSGPATQLSGFTITGGQRLGTEPHDRGGAALLAIPGRKHSGLPFEHRWCGPGRGTGPPSPA